MFKFSTLSQNRLATCCTDLQAICHLALQISPIDFSVICGYRDAETQNKAYAEGKSGVMYPVSYHNKAPSLAVDLAPYPLDWNDITAFKIIGSSMCIAAYKLDIKNFTWGAFWKKGQWQNKTDWGHFQIDQ
jgi:peptidoglycan L-alanyl-D-glutamate endopeptidase CwlK